MPVLSRSDLRITSHGLVTRATVGDAEELSRSLRPADRAELEDITGGPAIQSLLSGVLLGDPAVTMRTHDGGLVGILSVVPHGLYGGFVAMSGTPLIEENRAAFLRGSLDLLGWLDARYETLMNVADARNETHIRWLRWLGFSLIRRIDDFGHAGVPVYEFARIRPNV